ncbi:hypothetical protein DC915_RS03120 [Vibrio parahaemolyticus]|nr:hypothetical protein [Vibrio parahaemolyticus]EJG0009971.1 hypothetical protein [Vibrio parahaemolyticus]
MFGIFNKLKTQPASDAELIQAWLDDPLSCIKGQFDKPVEWHTCYGLAPMEGLPDTHGYSQLPDLKVTARVRKTEVNLGWIEGISMHSGGIARVRHFALQTVLTEQGYGEVLLNSIIDLLKGNYATKIEFRETHTIKIEHYRKLFAKNDIEEVTKGVWAIDLYPEREIPEDVLDFQASLFKSNR